MLELFWLQTILALISLHVCELEHTVYNEIGFAQQPSAGVVSNSLTLYMLAQGYKRLSVDQVLFHLKILTSKGRIDLYSVNSANKLYHNNHPIYHAVHGPANSQGL